MGKPRQKACRCSLEWRQGWRTRPAAYGMTSGPHHHSRCPMFEVFDVSNVPIALNTPAPADPINPDHYKRGGIEAFDVIRAWRLGFLEGSALYYILRAKFKGSEIEDLKKARRMLDRAIEEKTDV